MSAPAPLRLRPLEIGDLLDETFRMYRRHFFLFAGISIILSIPLAVGAGFSFFNLFNNLAEQTTSTQPPDLGPTLLSLAIILVLAIALYPLLYGSITYAACESALGRPVTFWGAMRAAFRRYLHIIGYFLLLTGMGILFCLFPLWIWIGVRWIAWMPTMFVENIGLGAALGRSWRLVEGRWWRTFLILFLMYILIEVVAGALQAFLSLGQFVLQAFVSTYLSLAISEATGILVSSLVAPILQIATVLIYFDLRVRREGLDLFQLAQRFGAPTPAA
ncbi:MAG TPA: glycerophosphoryl diester phosphodiesterase membrane domain-containing protein [Candidatus Dormibacteraeota bacterium]